MVYTTTSTVRSTFKLLLVFPENGRCYLAFTWTARLRDEIVCSAHSPQLSTDFLQLNRIVQVDLEPEWRERRPVVTASSSGPFVPRHLLPTFMQGRAHGKLVQNVLVPAGGAEPQLHVCTDILGTCRYLHGSYLTCST